LIYYLLHLMSCFVYFLYSESRKKYYVGISNDVADRLLRHNNGQNLSTKGGIPWRIIYLIECIDKSKAMQLESKIKKRGIARYLYDNDISSPL
jgi:putative endonuclease